MPGRKAETGARNLAVLAEAWREKRMVRVRQRAMPKEAINGFVVDLTARFVVLHREDVGSLLVLDGYCALPLREVAKVRLLEENDRFVERALAVKGIPPQPLSGVHADDFPLLLTSVDAHFPLMTIFREHLRPDKCVVGRVVTAGKRAVTMRLIDPAARWEEGTAKFRYRDITRVDFGGGYEDALWRVAQSEGEYLRGQD